MQVVVENGSLVTINPTDLTIDWCHHPIALLVSIDGQLLSILQTCAIILYMAHSVINPIFP